MSLNLNKLVHQVKTQPEHKEVILGGLSPEIREYIIGMASVTPMIKQVIAAYDVIDGYAVNSIIEEISSKYGVNLPTTVIEALLWVS